MIKIAVTGASGRMGQEIIKIIEKSDKTTFAAALDQGDDINLVLSKFETIIDFSRPLATIEYLQTCVENNKNIVIGTTGFSDEQLQTINAASKKIAIVFAPNMSIGVNLSLKLLAMAAKVIGDDADIEIVETHHRYKVDAPSGTALKMGEVIANTLGRDLKQCAIYGREGVGEERDKKTIGFATIRGGDVVGEHTVSFFTEGERIEITHKASSRATFANGAIRAATWLQNKPAGLYSMQDVLDLES